LENRQDKEDKRNFLNEMSKYTNLPNMQHYVIIANNIKQMISTCLCRIHRIHCLFF